MPKIASIERIVSVTPHPDAHSLDLVKVLGYQCVTQKGLYQTGQRIVFIQPDSILPEVEWAEGYRKYSPKRIKAVRLRGEWSEGIIVPIEVYTTIVTEKVSGGPPIDGIEPPMITFDMSEGADVAAEMGILHYEPPAPQDLSAKGLLPLGIPKTDEERWENMKHFPFDEPVNITLKIDGQSASYWYDYDTDTFGFGGRTLEFKPEAQNKYSIHIKKYDLETKMRAYGQKHKLSFVLRGESFGQGIQSFGKNPHSKLPNDIAFYSVYLIKDRRYATYGQQHYFIDVCAELDLPIVPTMPQVLTPELIKHFSEVATEIDGKPFEGVVVNHGPYVVARLIDMPDGSKKTVLDPVASGSFKIINKFYDSRK